MQIIQEIFSLIKIDKISPQEYARMKDEYSDEEYIQEQTQKAMNKGLRKGMEKGMLIVAKNMKEAKVAVKTIIEVTGLSVEQIENL